MWILNDFAMISPVDRRFDYFLWEPKPGAQFGDYLPTINISWISNALLSRWFSELPQDMLVPCRVIIPISVFLSCQDSYVASLNHLHGLKWFFLLESSVSNQHVDILPTTQTLNEWSI